MKLRGKVNKIVLRRYAETVLPTSAAQRKKVPFYAPLELFVKERTFQDMVADTLSDRQVRDRGLLRPEAVAVLRETMLKGEFMHVKQVFSLLALELWCRQVLDRGAMLR
jgi:asparagine synthetase B (glutamine-hydrolysing)